MPFAAQGSQSVRFQGKNHAQKLVEKHANKMSYVVCLLKRNLGAGGNQKVAGAIMDGLDSRRLAFASLILGQSEGVEQLINIVTCGQACYVQVA